MEIANINSTNVRNCWFTSWFKYKLKNINPIHVFDCLFNDSNVLVTMDTFHIYYLFRIRHAADLNDPFFSELRASLMSN